MSRDNGADRATGAYWETQFAAMAYLAGRPPMRHMYGIDGIDVTCHPTGGREHYEIKNKNLDGSGCYGLERYRLDGFIRHANTTGEPVYYAIHDWELAGAADAHERVPNDIAHWFVADIAVLALGCTDIRTHLSYRAGHQRPEPQWFWSPRYFHPLAELWEGGTGMSKPIDDEPHPNPPPLKPIPPIPPAPPPPPPPPEPEGTP